MSWEIKGQSGKAMNATLRTFAELGITAATLRFQSLAEDTFTWTAKTTSAAGGGTVIPERGQLVELYYNGNRKFRGHVMRPKRNADSVTIQVQGPWWWMNQIYLTQNQTDSIGGTDDRVQYVFETGDLRANIIALLDRAIANGVPMLRGTGTQIAEMYDFTKITLSNMTVAAAFSKMLARVPDAVAWFDYLTEGEAPKLKIARRNGADAATATTFTIGTDIFDGDISIYPREDLEVKRVELPYLDRHPNSGKPRFQRQSSGTTAAGKLQIITVSGPEIVDFLPKDDFESKSIKTVSASAITSDFVGSNDSTLAQIKAEYGLAGTIGNFFRTYSGDTNQLGGVTNLVTTNHQFPVIAYQKDNGSYINDVSGKFLVVSADLPQWAKEQWNGIDVTITGTWIAFWTYATQGNNFSDGFEALRAGAQVGSGLFDSGLDPDSKRAWAARPFSVRGVLLESVSGLPDNPPWAAAKTVYKKWDYDFLTPPAGMSAGLRVAQDWVPWEGNFSLVYDEVNGTNNLGDPINIVGTETECATMKALVKSLEYDIQRGRAKYSLGAPARIDLGTAMGRVQVNPQDVIKYIG